jgi:hypothetical protein
LNAVTRARSAGDGGWVTFGLQAEVEKVARDR